MKKSLTILLLVTGLFAQSGFNLVGGINYSTVSGDDIEDVENLMGFRFGLEKFLANGLIATATYSQRGFSSSYNDYYYDGYWGWVTEKEETDVTINYLSFSLQKPFLIQSNLNLVAGGEFGYFYNAKLKYSYTYEDDVDYFSDSGTEEMDGDDWEDGDGNKIDYGLVIGGRYSINQQITLVGTYFLGMANLFDVSDSDTKNRSFQLNVSYSF